MVIKMNKLKQIRKIRGLTQRNLADYTKISIKTIQAYEQGTRDIRKASIDNINKICDVLNCSEKELI